jgi:hypothetical protein
MPVFAESKQANFLNPGVDQCHNLPHYKKYMFSGENVLESARKAENKGE